MTLVVSFLDVSLYLICNIVRTLKSSFIPEKVVSIPTEAKKKHLNEIFLLRGIACLSIVLLHSLGVAQAGISDINAYLNMIVNSIRVLLTFGTPTFIFISIFIISYSYPNGVKSNFLNKRVKSILLPFLFMAVSYAFFYGITGSLSIKEILINSLFNILGGFHGYFVLVIFQFYIIFYLFNNYLSKKDPHKVILISLLINLGYLSIFNFFNSPIDNDLINYFWSRGHWIPFLGWIFYFTIAYYSGKNYSNFLIFLNKNKNKKIFLFLSVFTGILAAILVNLNIIPVSSKNVIMIFFTISIIALIYCMATNLKETPYFFKKISEYSFSIYLLHFFFFSIILKILKILKIDLGIFNFLFLFLGGVIGSMLASYIINKFKFGKYLVGGINIVSNKNRG